MSSNICNYTQSYKLIFRYIIFLTLKQPVNKFRRPFTGYFSDTCKAQDLFKNIINDRILCISLLQNLSDLEVIRSRLSFLSIEYNLLNKNLKKIALAILKIEIRLNLSFLRASSTCVRYNLIWFQLLYDKLYFI